MKSNKEKTIFRVRRIAYLDDVEISNDLSDITFKSVSSAKNFIEFATRVDEVIRDTVFSNDENYCVLYFVEGEQNA